MWLIFKFKAWHSTPRNIAHIAHFFHSNRVHKCFDLINHKMCTASSSFESAPVNKIYLACVYGMKNTLKRQNVYGMHDDPVCDARVCGRVCVACKTHFPGCILARSSWRVFSWKYSRLRVSSCVWWGWLRCSTLCASSIHCTRAMLFTIALAYVFIKA